MEHLFEVSWEVANRGRCSNKVCSNAVVGGIYTVIKTKTGITVEEYGDKYCIIGPHIPQKASLEVEQREPTCPVTAAALNAMREKGVHYVYGKWLVDGSPNVLLFDLGSVAGRLYEWKADLWEKASIPSPANDMELHDAILLGYCVAWFLGEVCAVAMI